MPRAKTAERGVARKLYVEDGLTPSQIAKRVRVSESGVQNWAKKGGWREQREMFLGGPKSVHERLKTILQKKLTELEDKDPEAITAALLDGIQKLYSAVNRSAETISMFEAAVVAGEEFVGFVRRRVPDEPTRAVIFEVWEEFLEKVKD